MSSVSCSSAPSSSPSHSLVDSNANAQQQQSQRHSHSLLSQHRYAPSAHSLLLGSAPTSFLTRGGGHPFASSSRPSPMDIIGIIDETLDIIGDDFSPSHMDTISSPSRGQGARRTRRQRQQHMGDDSSCDSNDSDSHNNKFGSQHSRQ